MNRKLLSAIAIVVALATVALPAAADDRAVQSMWNELVEWVTEWVTPTVAADPPPISPDDEILPVTDPHG
ncbi:MAG: hypothetical protein AAGN66_11085 [Acidobacteriota bacterium]